MYTNQRIGTLVCRWSIVFMVILREKRTPGRHALSPVAGVQPQDVQGPIWIVQAQLTRTVTDRGEHHAQRVDFWPGTLRISGAPNIRDLMRSLQLSHYVVCQQHGTGTRKMVIIGVERHTV